MTRPTNPAATWKRLVPALVPAGLALAAVLALADGAGAAATATVKASLRRGVLTVTGTGGADAVTVRLAAGDPNTVEIDVSADGAADFRFDRQRLDTIVVDGKGGDDTLVASPFNGTFTDTERTTLRGGDGADTLLGANGPELLEGGLGADFLDGNQGADVVSGGDGADVFQWDPGDASDILDGGGDGDRLVFNGANIGELFEVSAVGGHVRLTRNVATITMDLDGIERVDLPTRGGADIVRVADLTGTDLTELNADLALFGAPDGLGDEVVVDGTAGDDTVSVVDEGATVAVHGLATVVRVSGADAALDRLTVNGLAGNDVITATPGAGALLLLALLP